LATALDVKVDLNALGAITIFISSSGPRDPGFHKSMVFEASHIRTDEIQIHLVIDLCPGV
jgi:hypothetical protein